MTEDATGNRADNNERRVHFRSGYDLKSARAMYQYFFGRQYDDKSIDLEITKLFCEADGLVSLPEALVLALMLRKDFHRGRSRSRAADIFPELKAQEKAAARKRFKARVDELITTSPCSPDKKQLFKNVKIEPRQRTLNDNEIAIAPWVNHDLRSVVRKNLSALDVADHVAEMVLGGRKGLQRVYDVHRYWPQSREALERWAERLRSIVAPQPPPPAPDNVVALKKARG